MEREHDATTRSSLDTMSGPDPPLDNVSAIDARLFELQDEMMCLRIVHNALVPLSRLPDKLLVHVARHSIPDTERGPSKDMYTMASVSSRLRTVLICTPELWADIECT